jgi:dipeptidase E
MKLLLTSAGITNDSIATALRNLVGKPLTETKAAFILTAKNNREISAVEAMANQIAQLDKYQIPYILVDPSFDTDWRKKLEDVEVIVLGGGNTFHLLNEARKTRFDEWLQENASKKIIVGISAGSIILSPYIAIAAVDGGDENAVGITDLTGLNFVDFEISPHTPEDVSIEGNLAYSKTTRDKILMLDNNSTVQVTDDGIEIVSEGQYQWCQSGQILSLNK